MFGSSVNAAKSCQHILEVGDSRGNGEYWIDPEGNGNPFKVFCDMNTDGGGSVIICFRTLSSTCWYLCMIVLFFSVFCFFFFLLLSLYLIDCDD